jgi:NADH-quinone oxidoreductase subunit H
LVFIEKIRLNFQASLYFYYLIIFLFFILMILISVAFFTYLERKKLANIQSRQGPNKIGYFGTLQPFIDGLKLFLKETIAPQNSFIVVFFLVSVYSFFAALCL